MPFEQCYHTGCPTPKVYISSFIPKTIIANAVNPNLDGGALETIKLFKSAQEMDPKDAYNDYIVVYCDSNHKNIFPIITPSTSKKPDEQKEEQKKGK